MQAYDTVSQLLGLGAEAKDLTFVQISLRLVIVFIASLVMVRLAHKRFLSRMTAFDATVGFIMASMLARAVNGSAAFFPTLGAGFVLIAVHALFAKLSFSSEWFGFLVKGNPRIVVKEGKADQSVMAAAKISEKDILEEARLNGPVMSIEDIRLATLERNGQISVVPKE